MNETHTGMMPTLDKMMEIRATIQRQAEQVDLSLAYVGLAGRVTGGKLCGNIATGPTTGVYRWTPNDGMVPTMEQMIQVRAQLDDWVHPGVSVRVENSAVVVRANLDGKPRKELIAAIAKARGEQP